MNNEGQESILDYIQRTAVSFAKCCPGRFNWYEALAAHGKAMSPAELTAEEADYIKALARRRRFQPNSCFQNSFKLMLEDAAHRLTHWHGLAKCYIYPFPHAWVAIGDKVVDVTLDRFDKKRKNKSRREYFGVEIPRGMLRDLIEYDFADVFIQDGHTWDRMYQVRRGRDGPTSRP